MSSIWLVPPALKMSWCVCFNPIMKRLSPLNWLVYSKQQGRAQRLQHIYWAVKWNLCTRINDFRPLLQIATVTVYDFSLSSCYVHHHARGNNYLPHPGRNYTLHDTTLCHHCCQCSLGWISWTEERAMTAWLLLRNSCSTRLNVGYSCYEISLKRSCVMKPIP